MRVLPLPLFALAAALFVSSPVTAQAPADAVTLDVDPPGNEKTKSPSFDEWSKATKVRLTRAGPAAAPCAAYRVREWLKIRCLGTKPHAMVVLGGDAAEVSFWIDKDERRGGEVQFPMRKGDRRVIQIWTGGLDKAGLFKAIPSLVIQEHWLEDRAAPTVTAM
ncbi:hypothetical protein [Polyangium spumosum]|uniref:Uncharacterized protein n=1 Tax=Polyangium spumosum TaxID=889282 RepID=A0A6N7Q6J5_9BACT|nr:hypothetical protein [Polyangium spumosum]MRG98325.1 hypothetical protein [Polyangium spumosum]